MAYSVPSCSGTVSLEIPLLNYKQNFGRHLYSGKEWSTMRPIFQKNHPSWEEDACVREALP